MTRRATPLASTQPALLTRLLQAVAAGGLLVVPGCGAEATSGFNEGTGSEHLAPEGSSTSTGAPTTPGETTSGNTSNQSTNVETTSSATTQTDTQTNPTTQTSTQTSPATQTDTRTNSTTQTSTEAVQCEWDTPQQFCLSVERMENQARFGFGQIPLDPPRSDEEVAAAYDENGCMRHDWVATSCCNLAEAPGVPQGDGSCCYVACEGACCGRPLIVNGQALIADVQRRSDWLQAPPEQPGVEVPAEAARALADAWLADALMEHASVASFSRFALDLMALGAPPQLLADAQRAALDEIDHAQRCFSIASRLAGERLGPGPLPTSTLEVHALPEAVRAAIVEGCIGETLAAGIAREQAAVAGDAEARAALLRIAEDELRHAELAWRFVAWAINLGGESVRKLAAATFQQHLARAPVGPQALALEPSLMNHWGRLTETQWRCTAQFLISDVLEPAARALVEPQPSAPHAPEPSTAVA